MLAMMIGALCARPPSSRMWPSDVVIRKALTPPAIADGDSDGPLGCPLADDVPIQLLDNLPRGHFSHASSSTWMFEFV